MAATFKCQPTGLHGWGIDASGPPSSRNFGRFYSMRFACNTSRNKLRHVHAPISASLVNPTPLSISRDSPGEIIFLGFFLSFFLVN